MHAGENCFRSDRIERIRYRISAEQAEQLVTRFLSSRYQQACILGPMGTGKTTLLEDLQAPLENRGIQVHWIRIQRESSEAQRQAQVSRIQHLGADASCFFDGAEAMTRLGWLRFRQQIKRQGCRLLATRHWHLQMPVLYRTTTNWPIALDLVQGLAGKSFSPEMELVAKRAFKASKGNVREVFRACYWHLAKH
ncbi:AAA family ATPase [Coraliomargarita akajimensis]|uniref:AAA+ ATPase domain-containing protein n=1 Tax=Coraliomargarita akajimensis (strain DSM 45221 / IAM 15411 / JCM 23193 / KCTC 12865 / 04OKA010-24) TaxID=583355 RepID=D5EQX8_CORAD|nr:AAA family ATPase [Coraliomargarita akajimensis]ADE53971.1 hypothetical protein Caka_0949 [Coraliomargarita akajimensis DSM 45221]